MPTLTIEQQCLLFNCTEAQLKKQFAANLLILKQMYRKAVNTGKKQGNLTADQLRDKIEAFERTIC